MALAFSRFDRVTVIFNIVNQLKLDFLAPEHGLGYTFHDADATVAWVVFADNDTRITSSPEADQALLANVINGFNG